MNDSRDVPALERPAFFDGQLLGASDLAAVAAYQREMRWLHNRTLHGWGIARGLTVTGGRGDRDVAVSAGYALDCHGRDLLLAAPATLSVPPVAGGPGGSSVAYYLTISYLDDAELPASESRIGPCGEAGAVRRPERARLRWQSQFDTHAETRYRRGLDVLLAAVTVADCRLTEPASGALRRELPPPCGPHIATGITPAGATEWRLYPQGGAVLGVETTVDTSAGGFGRPPVYSASVVGERRLGTAGGLADQIIDGAASVESPAPKSFVLRVLLPRDIDLPPYRLNPASALNLALPARLRDDLEWRVSWMGVEG